ncbi:UDP-D-galactose--(glucosyl)lipopolysaccharide-1,6-D-galactosyltransferase [Photorhabdus luminescens]|uniref:UDP-D-galactose--(Glucosyl)lipopolysaccharide-1, 6-D-galactosyltransferase n=1 Tax=Photorhabdus akhurstii TaxID=171438 RepID=A0ABX8LRC2_9GAMM|nr:lipopolysaccharide 1,6-galactosyltransferase [Photorhabdus akhurstii]QXF32106.1 UDP-D-galactose--(glucosyl)lipopolysaccharide-1,6-D-galactosyltransferase [Photorhabdus akhurstii]UJD73899.1 UDP-D-galactose--(glucosyl)lipopolysaccharide-1,6-D-galactosyltransferase [Photorhabdus luminescens]
MKNIFIIYHDLFLNGYGGVETVCSNLINLLDRANIEINFIFISLNEINRIESRAWLSNAQHISLMSNSEKSRQDIACELSLILKRFCPDILISLDTTSCNITRLSCEKINFPAKVYSWLHTSIRNPTPQKIKDLCCADEHLVISSGLRDQMLSFGIKPEKLHLIFNPIKMNPFIIPQPKHIARFLYVGRILAYKSKNLTELFLALSQLHGHWELHMVGSGDDEGYLRELSSQLNINNNIIWHGWQDQPWEFVMDNIKEVSAFILTSKYEGFGMVLAEAISYGIYCISSDCQCGPSDIINNLNGELYKSGSIIELSEKLQLIIDEYKIRDHQAIKNSIAFLYEYNFLLRITKALPVLAQI